MLHRFVGEALGSNDRIIEGLLNSRALAYAAWLGGYEGLLLEPLSQVESETATPALCDLALRVSQEHLRISALRLLQRVPGAVVAEVFRSLLESPSGPIRAEALRQLKKRLTPQDHPRLKQLLREDHAPLVRRMCLEAVHSSGRPELLMRALDDPVWRVRRHSLRLLERDAQAQPDPQSWLKALRAEAEPDGPLASRALRFLTLRLSATSEEPLPPPAPPWTTAPWWDPDPAVMVGQIKHLSPQEQAAQLKSLLELIQLQEGYPLNDQMAELRDLIARLLHRFGDEHDWIRALSWMEHPRTPFVWRWALKQAQEAPAWLPQKILEAPKGLGPQLLSWALERGGAGRNLDPWLQHPLPTLRSAALKAGASLEALERGLSDPNSLVIRTAVDCLIASDLPLRIWRGALPPEQLEQLARCPEALSHLPASRWSAWAEDPRWALRMEVATSIAARPGFQPEAEARLQADPDHRVRARACTFARAQLLWKDPQQEPSWRVLAAAATRLQRPLSELAPEDLSKLQSITQPLRAQKDSYFRVDAPKGALRRSSLALQQPLPPLHPRQLGGQLISPLAISGRHALHEDGYEIALERGINLFFWELDYRPLSRWLRSLPDSLRQELVIIGGSFASEPRHVLRDLEQARSTLGVDRLGAFILFWVRSQARLSDELAEALVQAQAAGHMATFGLSTHNRGLAAEAILEGWPLVMVRHSAGHPGAEQEVFPLARAQGCELITFNNLCYGLMLEPRGGLLPPYSPADCYRYSLSQPGVSLALSAPSSIKQLKQNLEVLERPLLSLEEQDQMRRFVAPLRGETRQLLRLIRAQ